MSQRDRGLIGVIEATYGPGNSEADWLRAMLRAAAPIADQGCGVLACVYEGAVGSLRAGTCVEQDLVVAPEVFSRSLEAMAPSHVDETWRAQSFGLCSELGPLEKMPGTRPMLDAGIRDVLNINAYDPSGIGVTLAVPLPAARTRGPNEADRWTRVASHMASALRLRRYGTIAPSPDAATAVLDTTGRCEHAADGKTADRLRRALRDAVLRMEAARGPMRDHDPDGAVDSWRTLVDAELTLLDHFDHAGKRYVIAVENPPRAEIAGLSALSMRESQVVAAAAAGRTNKIIAYELGLAHSTVRVLLARAAKRLKAESRQELVAIYRAHQRAGHDRS